MIHLYGKCPEFAHRLNKFLFPNAQIAQAQSETVALTPFFYLKLENPKTVKPQSFKS